MVAWTVFVSGSIRTMDPAFGTLTQMLPKPAPSQFGPELPVGPTGMVATTLFVAGWIRSTFPSCVAATQTAEPVASTPFRKGPTSIAFAFEVVGSIRKRVVVSQSVTQTPFLSTDMAL